MWATLSTGEHFYKNIRENTTNTNRRRNWIASVTVVKNRATSSPLFFRRSLDRKVCVWFRGKSPSTLFLSTLSYLREFAEVPVSVPDRFLCALLYYLITPNCTREWTVNSTRQQQFYLRESFPSRRDAAERANTAQLTCLKMDLRQPGGRPTATQDNWLEISSECFYSALFVFSPRGVITVADGQNYSTGNLTRESPLLRKLGTSMLQRGN